MQPDIHTNSEIRFFSNSKRHLPMEMLDDDIIQAGLSAERQASSLVRQAISASTTHEKNKLIAELKQVWRLQESCAQQLYQSNAAMRENLAKLEDKGSAKTTLYETLCRNTAFLENYERNPPGNGEREEKITQIRDIEADIQRVGTLSAPELLRKAAEANDPRQLKLLDLKFKRLEELSYNLKKRSFVVDESEDLSLMVSEEFGSLHGLIETHEQLLEENQRLKREEEVFVDDSLVKRRKLKTISGGLLTEMVVTLQHELQMQRDVGKTFPVPAQDDGGHTDFDEFLGGTNGRGFEFAKNEFSTTMKIENVATLMSATDPQVQLNALSEVVVEQKQTISKLKDELAQLRAKVYTPDETDADAQWEQKRHWQIYDKFQRQMSQLQEQITATNDEARKVYEQIQQTIYERKCLGENLGDWLHKYKALVNDEVYLMGLAAQNTEIVRSLSSVSFALGVMLMNNNEEDRAALNAYLRASPAMVPSASSDSLHMPAPPPTGSDKAGDEEEDEAGLNRMEMIKKSFRKRSQTLVPPRRPRRIHAGRNEHSEEPSMSEPQVHEIEPNNPIYKASRVQLLDFISKAFDIRSVIEPKESMFHADVLGKLHYSLGNLRSMFYQDLHAFEEEMRAVIAKVEKCSDIILRVPKADVATEANTEPRADNNAQTEEEEKGKGKKPQPPAKAKKSPTPRRGKAR